MQLFALFNDAIIQSCHSKRCANQRFHCVLYGVWQTLANQHFCPFHLGILTLLLQFFFVRIRILLFFFDFIFLFLLLLLLQLH